MTTKRESTRAASDNGPDDYVIRVIDDPAMLDSQAWDDLLARQAAPTPFMSARYLIGAAHLAQRLAAHGLDAALRDAVVEARRCVRRRRLYLKTHSWGEYVFDWAWAEAYQRHGLALLPQAAGRACRSRRCPARG